VTFLYSALRCVCMYVCVCLVMVELLHDKQLYQRSCQNVNVPASTTADEQCQEIYRVTFSRPSSDTECCVSVRSITDTRTCTIPSTLHLLHTLYSTHVSLLTEHNRGQHSLVQSICISFLTFHLCRMCVCHMFNKVLTNLLTYLLLLLSILIWHRPVVYWNTNSIIFVFDTIGDFIPRSKAVSEFSNLKYT